MICMGKGFMSLLMGGGMRGNILMILNMGRGLMCSEMARNILEDGVVVLNMEKER